jgi:hypothetical protein
MFPAIMPWPMTGRGFGKLRLVLAPSKAELAPVWRERDKAHSSRDTPRKRDKARAEKNAVHAKAREARDATRKGWDDLVMLVEKERASVSEDRRGIEFKIVEATMVERERWASRIRAADNRWEAGIAIAIAGGVMPSLRGIVTRPCAPRLWGAGRGGREGFAPRRLGP